MPYCATLLLFLARLTVIWCIGFILITLILSQDAEEFEWGKELASRSRSSEDGASSLFSSPASSSSSSSSTSRRRLLLSRKSSLMQQARKLPLSNAHKENLDQIYKTRQFKGRTLNPAAIDNSNNNNDNIMNVPYPRRPHHTQRVARFGGT